MLLGVDVQRDEVAVLGDGDEVVLVHPQGAFEDVPRRLHSLILNQCLRGPRAALSAGRCGDGAACLQQMLTDLVGGAGDGGLGAEGSEPGAQFAEDSLGVPGEVGVDVYRFVMAGQDLLHGREPARISWFFSGKAAAQEDDVGDDVGAGGCRVGAGGQAHRAQEVAEFVQAAPGVIVLGVEGEPGCDVGDDAAGPYRCQCFEDGQVVDRQVPLRAEFGVEGLEVAIGDVADGGREVRLGQPCVLQLAGQDLGIRVQVPGQSCGDRVEFYAEHLHRLGGVLRCLADEVARAAARFQDGATVEAEIAHGRPYRPHHRGVGVERRDGVPAREIPLDRRQQFADASAYVGERLPAGEGLAAVVGVVRGPGVEDLWQCAPARPAAQDPLFLAGRRPVGCLQLPQQHQGGDVRLRAPDGRRRRPDGYISRLSVPGSFGR
ncbi:hypothetical protein [Streptomyces sp. NPDC050428]|uniref:hypothetical protein n=1 Tax=Streptomyces sp. NPDC050428 TaxID=3155757 RepID=UPI00341C28B7